MLFSDDESVHEEHMLTDKLNKMHTNNITRSIHHIQTNVA